MGISSSHRSSGAGTALIASATLDLARRGADGCFIDWIRPGLVDFYALAGYELWERYWCSERKVEVGEGRLL